MTHFPESELVINVDGGIYHLNLRPEQIARTVLTVGDPERVGKISKYFDTIEEKVSKREFVTHTGRLGDKRLSVISSGIGADNIDIVVNELDALVNIDFATRQPKVEHTSLNIIRIGTSGGIQANIPVDSIVVSAFAIGLDNLLYFYDHQNNLSEASLFDDLSSFQEYSGRWPVTPYVFEANSVLMKQIGKDLIKGITITSPGFYAPQGRILRGGTRFNQELIKKLAQFEYNGLRILNFEMETSAIYGLCKILGHRALSCNVILANRVTREFTREPKATEEKLIKTILEKIADSDL